MNVDKTKIGIIIKSARVRDEAQEAMLRACGASWILRIPKQVRSWRPIVNEVQPGDVVFVPALVLVPTDKGQDPRSPTSQIGDFVASVHANGGYIFECYTGLKSNIAKQRSAMLDAAMLGMRKGGRPLPAIGKDPGRPKTKWPSPEVETEARRIWKSVDYTTRAAAIRHMPKGVNSTLIKTLGPRGKLKTRIALPHYTSNPSETTDQWFVWDMTAPLPPKPVFTGSGEDASLVADALNKRERE